MKARTIPAVMVPVVFFVVVSGALARAEAAPAYAFGIAPDYVVVPGSTVVVTGVLRNLGDAPIVFAPALTQFELPSIAGGSVASFNAGTGPGDFRIIDTVNTFFVANQSAFFSQFDGVSVALGADFPFVLGSFVAPMLPLGSTASFVQMQLELFYTDDIRGVMTSISKPGVFDFSCFQCTQEVLFTLGAAAFQSDLVFKQGIVVDGSTGTLLSGPPTPAPEPSTLISVIVGVVVIAGPACIRRRRPRWAHVRLISPVRFSEGPDPSPGRRGKLSFR
jgi:hypothetical protein